MMRSVMRKHLIKIVLKDMNEKFTNEKVTIEELVSFCIKSNNKYRQTHFENMDCFNMISERKLISSQFDSDWSAI